MARLDPRHGLILPRSRAESGRPAEHATPVAKENGGNNMQASQLGLVQYLARLHSHLDTATFTATLDLMTCECRTAISKQRGLIALQRLGGHDTSAAMQHLDDLVTREAGLSIAFALAGASRGLGRGREHSSGRRSNRAQILSTQRVLAVATTRCQPDNVINLLDGGASSDAHHMMALGDVVISLKGRTRPVHKAKPRCGSCRP